MAEELVSNNYKMSASQWLGRRYDVKTLAELKPEEIIDGPFAEFLGMVDSIDEAKGKVKVLVSIFGRETPVELDFLQVSKL